MSIAKRVTYLKGLAEGLNLGNDTKEEKVLQAIIEILEEMSVELEDLTEDVLSLDDDVTVLVEDLQDLEDELFEDDEDEDECTCDCDCGCCGKPAAPSAPPAINCVSSNGGNGNGNQFYAVQCPKCQNKMQIDDAALKRGILVCSKCGERLELDLEEPA